MSALDDVRSLARARELIDSQLEELVVEVLVGRRGSVSGRSCARYVQVVPLPGVRACDADSTRERSASMKCGKLREGHSLRRRSLVPYLVGSGFGAWVDSPAGSSESPSCRGRCCHPFVRSSGHGL